MQGDFSRLTFHREKHFAMVLRQQGRVDVDADWNEQQAILRHTIETEGVDVIGPAGAPEGSNGGFQIGPTADAKDLTVSKGRMYVGGILCENDADGVTVLKQPDLPAGPGGTVAGVSVPPPAGTYVAYLDVWLRHLTAADDPSIREKALGGPDAASRAKVIWQVKLQKVDDGAGCDAFVPPAGTTGTLAARTAPVDPGSGPCVLPPTAGYRRLENQLYRVEVHNPGPRATATFKWSRDNGSVVTTVLGGGQSLTVHDTGPDDYLGFRDDQRVELLDERSDLTDHRGTLLQIAQAPDANGGITIKAATPVPPIDLSLRPRLRRWDQAVTPSIPDVSNGVPMTAADPAGWIALEDGLQVQFADGDYHSGDYWLIPARTAIDAETGNIEWPVSPGSPNPPLSLPPLGVVHAYAPLAVVDSTGTTLTVRSDCRPLFPPLTSLTGADCCCAVTLDPNEDWQSKLANALNQGGENRSVDASICFKVGEFLVTRQLAFRGLGSLKITGGGPGTRIRARRFETALSFEGYNYVSISDLYAESGRTGIFGDGMKDLGGVLTFRNCRGVDVHRVSLQGADGVRKAASCLTVWNDPTAPASVRVHHCDLAVGQYQVGILVVNADRVQIEDNSLSVSPAAQPIPFDRLMQNERLRGEFRRLLVAESPVTPDRVRRWPAVAADLVQATVTLGRDQGEEFRFFTPKVLAPHWQELVDANADSNLRRRSPTLRAFVQGLARRVLSDPTFRNAQARGRGAPRIWSEFFTAVLARPYERGPLTAAQGIVIGGHVAGDVRVRDNTVKGASQGIHVGLSHAGAKQGDPASSDHAATVLIEGNTVEVQLPLAVRGREGIFAGNCDHLIVANNRLTTAPAAVARELGVDGVCVYGYLGKVMVVRDNHLRAFPGGIYIHPLNLPSKVSDDRRPLWLVAENLIEGGIVRIDPQAVNDVLTRDNFMF
jgi:hypothetical protein